MTNTEALTRMSTHRRTATLMGSLVHYGVDGVGTTASDLVYLRPWYALFGHLSGRPDLTNAPHFFLLLFFQF